MVSTQTALVTTTGDSVVRLKGAYGRAAAWFRKAAMVTAVGALTAVAGSPANAAGSTGQMTWAVHVSLAPTWFDPAETPSAAAPFMVFYALHDAVVKPMPGELVAPSLAESFKVSSDGLSYEFSLRKNAKFHNGEPVTAEDVRFSFDRYRGTSAKVLKDRVAAVETPDPYKVIFRLKTPWPDFLTFYANATGAAWVVPKKYVEQVGEEGYKKAPIGAGPYKFTSFNPGVDLVMEAYDQYWRKTPKVKRLVFKSVPDEATRLIALKRGEVDIAYSIRGELAKELEEAKGLSLKPVVISSTYWLSFNDQWNPKSPWHDARVRLAASLAIDRKSINQALTLGHSKLTGSIIPDGFSEYWTPPEPVFDPEKAKKLLAEAGYPKGFDAGDYYCDSPYANLGEAIIDNLRTVGIRLRLRPLERASWLSGWSKNELRNVVQGASGAFGNSATRLETFVAKGGAFVHGSYPELDDLFKQQSTEIDTQKRQALLYKMQQILHERTVFAPVWQLAFLSGVRSTVKESGLGLISGHPYSAPYEDLALSEK